MQKMIYSLRGILLLAQPGAAVIECSGVGYRCCISLMTLSQLPPVGSEARLLTHLVVRDDAVELFGFADEDELACFRLLTSVSGVGNKLALSLLSDLTGDRLALAIASGDLKTLTRSSGVGSKLAQRIVLELKDKLGGLSQTVQHYAAIASAAPMAAGARSEAAQALSALGYSQSEAAAALATLDESLGVEGLVKAGLRVLSRRTQ